MAETWNVPVVKLLKDKVVVDLGGGHLVDLVGLIDKIQIKTSAETFTYNTLKDRYDDKQLIGPDGPVYNMVHTNKVTCDIPLYTEPKSKGGRHTKSHRPRPRHQRTTRRTTRRR